MSPDLLIVGIILLPVIVLALLRVNAAIIFLSLCLGSVLVQFMGSDAASFAELFSASKNVSTYLVSAILLALPAAFTTVVMIRTIRGGVRLALNLIPAVAVGVVGLLLIEPLLSPGTRGAIAGTTLWHDLQRAQSLVVGVSTLASLLFLWFQRPLRAFSESGKHRRH